MNHGFHHSSTTYDDLLRQAQLSPYGCSIGNSCYQEDCMRNGPEISSVTPPSFVEFLELLLLFSFILCCAGFCIHVGNAFKSATSHVTKRRDERYQSLGDVENVGGGQKRIRSPTEEEQWSVPIVELETETAVGRGVHCMFRWCCGCIVLTVGIFLLVVLIVYPHAPTYSVCNSELDWQSLLGSLSSLSLSADYDVAMSIRNPNLFNIRVDSLDATFTFEGRPVASAHLIGKNKEEDVVTLQSSSISDIVLPLTFAPESVSQAWQLKAANDAGTLMFEASFSIRGSVLGFYDYDIEIKNHVVDLSTMGDTSMCAPCRNNGR